MPFGFGRKAGPEPEPEPERVPESGPVSVTGDRPCTERGCPRHDAAPCAYVDRRGRVCSTAWCPDHQALFDAHVVCRRHAGTLRAIGLDMVRQSLAPDLENRAPSLVNWVCNDLDLRVRSLLLSTVPRDGLEELGEERVHLVRPVGNARHWDRSWKLFDHTGVTLKVTVTVAEADDTMVVIRLGRAALAEVVPPWIERHLGHVDVSPEQDAQEREIFYARLFDRISAAVTAERDGNSTLPWG